MIAAGAGPEEIMLKLQNIILEMIAKGDTLANTATRICIESEASCSGCHLLGADG